MPVERLGVKLYNLKESAQALGVSYATIKNYYGAGRITGQRIGRTVMITEGELQRFLNGGQPRHRADVEAAGAN
jgi:predicted site-specific integrase-resolvase